LPGLLQKIFPKGVFMNKAITDGVVFMPLPFATGLPRIYASTRHHRLES
jgi:hypothetical protein